MIALDAVVSNSGLIGAGPTSGSWDHEPSGTPRAAMLFVAHFDTSSSGIAAATYGGEAMMALGDYDNGTTPFPGVAMFFLDDIPAGEQTVAFAKAAGTTAYAVLVGVLADGTVLVADSDGGSGNNLEPAVPAMTAPDRCLGIAVNGRTIDAAATGRSHTLLETVDHGTYRTEVQSGIVGAGDEVMEWTYAAAALNARAGVLLADPNPPPPPTEWLIDFETGDLSQAAYVQAIPGRITVVTDPALEGVYSGRFEVQGGDVEPDTGSQRAELKTLLNFNEGDIRDFEVLVLVDQWDFDHWGILWQMHDNSDVSPPLALMVEEVTGRLLLQHGNGSVVYWRGPPIVLGQPSRVVIRVGFSATEGTLEVWLDGAKQTLVNGSAELAAVNTLGNPPGYDKVGIYRSIEATEPAVVYHGIYRVSVPVITEAPTTPSSVAMARPAASPFAEDLYEACGAWAYDDENQDWALLHLCIAIARQFDLGDQIIRPPFDDRGPWETLLDVDRTPAVFLPWLAQMVGVDPRGLVGLDEATQRTFIRETAGWRRGTPAAMIGAAQVYLTGAKTVRLIERDESAYRLTVITRTSETPDAAAVERALRSQKPAGIVLTHIVSDAPIIDEGTLDIDDVTATIDDAALADVT
jgi:hypothetical protein